MRPHLITLRTHAAQETTLPSTVIRPAGVMWEEPWGLERSEELSTPAPHGFSGAWYPLMMT